MGSLYCLLHLCWCFKVIDNMDASYHKDSIFCLNLARYLSNQIPFARIDLARFQRASKRACKSAASSSHNIIKRGCMRL
jgi:hypothetical protein